MKRQWSSVAGTTRLCRDDKKEPGCFHKRRVEQSLASLGPTTHKGDSFNRHIEVTTGTFDAAKADDILKGDTSIRPT